jgi:hypothetical protein
VAKVDFIGTVGGPESDHTPAAHHLGAADIIVRTHWGRGEEKIPRYYRAVEVAKNNRYSRVEELLEKKLKS